MGRDSISAWFLEDLEDQIDAGEQLEDLEDQVDAGEQLEDLEHQVDASDVSEMNRWQRFVILLLMAGEIAVRQLEELETDAPCRKDEDS